METEYALACEELRAAPRRWLVTGAAGFIGSNLLEQLLRLGQEVVALDDLSTGRLHNIEEAVAASGAPADRCRFIEADAADRDAALEACRGVDIVLHQAAMGSVPRSIEEPLATYACNVEGLVSVLDAARESGVQRLVYASSNSVYGDSTHLPQMENRIGTAQSPYAASKRVNEMYANMHRRSYGVELVGQRYFNVFGKRQNPDGPYSSVIPRWIGLLLDGQPCRIYGDGRSSRDFFYVDDVVQANLLAATAEASATGAIYNVASGDPTTLNELFGIIRDGLSRTRPELRDVEPLYEQLRAGEIRHSYADISRARQRLGYVPTHSLAQGLERTLDWYTAH
ncbi:NAD-dependent epimerase/dehydratase family protein [Candidatus Palauibacter sp.]|uniref:NAD-dependent epimerase/dehydratase family protein n=1 Tax=Candidatus Palauibacter sp. TaxID=3101350 RepID=UPI003AF26A7C